MTNSNFLKKLLTTASVIAVSASAGNALATARVTKGPAQQDGTNLEQSKVGNAAAANEAVAAGSTITFRGNHTYTVGGANAVNLAALNVDGNFTATIDATAGGANFTLGSVTRKTDTGIVNINLGNNTELTLTGQGAIAKGYIPNVDTTVAPGSNGTNWQFAAGGNDHSGLGQITFNTANDKLIINSDAQLNKAVHAAAAGKGIVEVNSANVIFSGGVTGGVGKLDIKDGKAATLGKASNVQTIQIGNGSTLLVADSINVTSNNIKASVADKGTLRFEGKSTVAATKIGGGTKLNAVELNGAGTVNFSTTTNFDATTTTLNHAEAVLQFSVANTIKTELATSADNAGKIIVANDVTIEGNIGAAGKSFSEVLVNSGKTLILGKDDTKLYAANVNAADDNTAILDINSANFEIHSNIGASDKRFTQINLNGDANGAATTFKLMDGKNITATEVDLSPAGGFDNTLELHEGSSITGKLYSSNANEGFLSIKGDAKIDGFIGDGGAINQIKFDTAKTLEVSKNTITTANGIDFLQDGTLNLTEDANFTFAQDITTKTDANGTGSIIVDSAANGRTIELQGQVGDVAAAGKDNMLKLLQATGGADIKLTNANIAIKKIDIGTQDANLILNNGNGQFLVGDFSHSDGKGTLRLDADATLKTGTNLSASPQNTLKAIDLTSNKTLTVEDGVNLYTKNDITGGIRSQSIGWGNLIFEGDSTVEAIVGASNAIDNINVTGKDKTVNFLNNVNLANANGGNGLLTISDGATAVLGGEFVGVGITGANAGQGTVKFNNNVALENATKITAAIGANQLDTVEIGGANITFTNAKFATKNLNFTNTGDTTVTFDGFAGNELQNTTITTNSTSRGHNIVLTKGTNQALNKSVGSAANPFGNFTLLGDDTITTEGGFYAGVVNSKNQEGTVIFNNNGGVGLNLGAAGSELKQVTINGDTVLSENVWSKDITVNANKAVTFKNSVTGSGSLALNNGSVANFTGTTANLNTAVTALAAGQGTLNFSNAATINATIGTAAKSLDNVNFTGTTAADIVNLNADIFANNINVGAQTVRAQQDIELNGATTANGATVDIATNKVTLKNGASRIVGNSAINVTLNGNKDTGSIVVDGSAGAASLDTTNITKLTVNVSDTQAMLPVTDEAYNLFVTANAGTITPLAAGKAVVTSNGNNFVEWSLNGNVLTRKNIASQALTNTFGTGDSELLADALQFVNPNNSGNAAAYAQELSTMDSGRLKESVERASEQNVIHANEVASNLMDGQTATINNRMGAFSNHPQPGVQIASNGVSGVAAGEGDHTMYGAWVSPFFSQTTQKARGSRAGYKADSYGATVGFDTQANADLTVGVAGTYAKTDTKHKDFKSGDKTKADTFMFSVYGIQQLTNNWFLQGHAAYASSKMKSSEKRTTITTSETARAEYDVTSYNAELLGGFNYSLGEAIVTPLIGASYTRVNSSGYTETGTTNQNLTVSTKATNKFEAVAGMRAQMTTELNGINVTPEIHGFVKHDLIGKDAKVASKISGMVNSLTPKSAKALKTTFNVGLGVNAVSGIYEYGAGYDLFAADKTIGHQGTLKVRVNF